MTVRTRIAPSPTGLPHVGNIRNGIYSWLLARRHGGQFVFRLEDTDRERYDPSSEQALYDAFRTLGLQYDEGPGVEGPHAPYVQSQRLPRYREAADRLLESGGAYRCFCTKERVAQVREARQKANIHPHGYDRYCRSLSREESERRAAAGEPHVIRFAIPEEGETTFVDEVRGPINYQNRELDDHVLLKSDGFPTYHLAHVVDDHEMRITHVIRSEEWLPSSPRHALTYQALGWEMPKLIHPGLIMGREPQSGKVSKLSKRHGATSVTEYLDQGYLPEVLLNFLALLGWSPGGDREIMSRDEMAGLFDVSGINASPSVFDPEKLSWMNGLYIRELSDDELLRRALPFLRKAGLVDQNASEEELEYARRVVKLEQERLKTLSETPHVTDFFFREQPEYDEAAVSKRLRAPGAGKVLELVLSRLQPVEPWTVENIEAAVRGATDELGVKAGEVIHPTRVAATGRTVGPGLFETLWALGKERVLRRIRQARETYADH